MKLEKELSDSFKTKKKQLTKIIISAGKEANLLSEKFGNKNYHILLRNQSLKKLIVLSISEHIKRAFYYYFEEKDKKLLRPTIVYTIDLINEALKSSNNDTDIKKAIRIRNKLKKALNIIDTIDIEGDIFDRTK